MENFTFIPVSTNDWGMWMAVTRAFKTRFNVTLLQILASQMQHFGNAVQKIQN